MANIAAMWRWDHPLYTEVDSASRYSLLYGPFSFLTVAFFQFFGSDIIFWSKLSGVFALWCSFFMLYAISIQWDLKRSERFWFLGAFALIICGFYNIGYWNRPDSYMILLTICSVFVAQNRAAPGWLLSFVIAALGAISSGYKLHGAIYIFPAYILLFESKGRIFRFSEFIAGVVGFLVLLLSPFLVRGVALENYLMWIQEASKHGLILNELFKNISYFSAYLLLLLFLQAKRKFKWTLLSIFFAGLIISFVGSKAGSGSSHLLPLLVFCQIFASLVYFRSPYRDQKHLFLVLGAFVLGLSLNAINRQKRVIELIGQSDHWNKSYADFREILTDLSGPIEFGYGGLDSYLLSSFKPELVQKYGVLLIDAPAVMDFQASHISLPVATAEALSGCQIPYIVLPRSAQGAWSLRSFYDGSELFPEAFRAKFASNYLEVRANSTFQLYKCKTDSGRE